MIVANATGCSSIYGGSCPATPYCTNAEGKGPAWANSLFEDNAEYGFGIAVGVEKLRERVALKMAEALEAGKVGDASKAAFKTWLESKDNAKASKVASAQVIAALKNEKDPIAKEIVELEQYLIKKSIWIFGGDGWAYDIGYGGLDHVIASGENVNIV